MPFEILHGDITRMRVDAIVNAANTKLQRGGGVCGAIFKAAGVREMQAACDALAPIQIGEAVITPGFALPAKYVIHTPGPRRHSINPRQPDLSAGEAERLLRNCYLNSLALAVSHGCKSVAFPLIATGVYGYPKDEALRVATAAIEEFLDKHRGCDLSVHLVMFDKAALEADGR
jgi:O-acetyl-ADP-ribose deacetylase (regulator of RNase III)